VVMAAPWLVDDATNHALNDQKAKQSYDISCYYRSLRSFIPCWSGFV